MIRDNRMTRVLLAFWLMLLALAGCTPADVRDMRAAVSDSATIVAIVSGDQPTVVPTKKPTRTPTSTAPTLAAVPTERPTRAPTKNVAPASTAAPGQRVKNTAGDFDFYVMSLSWSPDYCAGSNVNDPQQCSVGKKLGFVLHGLWPQYTRGYPADCSAAPLPKDAQQQFPNLYPSSKLYTHEWDKHGTCSGLTPEDYMALAKKLKESIVIPADYDSPTKSFRTTPEELISAFMADNPQLSADALAVQCSGSGRFLTELRVCFSREGQPIACSAEVQKVAVKSCGNADFLVRNVK